MAEIEIERKKKPVWPWILLVILLVIIGWVVYEYMKDTNQIGVLAPTAPPGMMALASAKPHYGAIV
ncbi:hypothetical protein [Pontibacter beigongshangensis]|uniref:hypothetical protein n=1 Tax=Pontibacter beigongshangensis TaxID=2574733 RepID=UPI0016509074|nr:hypothetical protein [Pontibacter beigongshangensis]